MDITSIISKLDNISSLAKPIVVFGDYCLDKYLYVDPARDEPSLETGLIAYQVCDVKCYPGAAGTVCNNLRALGAPVQCVGFYGNDGEGYDLIKALRQIGADTSLMVCSDEMRMCTYIKPMRGADGNFTELNRLDIRNFYSPSRILEDWLLENLSNALENASAIMILDQFVQRNMGTLTDYIREKLNAMAAEATKRGILFYVDSRAFADEYQNMIVKCNNLEFMSLGSMSKGDSDNADEIQKRAQFLKETNGNTYFITRGSKGMMVADENGVTSIDGFRVEGPIDIVGAGDASSAGIVLGLVLGMQSAEAAKFACAVSSITIQQIGCTGTATIPQVKERLKQ